MAITINNEPTGIYPAYNDSYLIYESDITGSTYSIITLEPASDFVKPFLVYPSPDGRFIFNLKDAVKYRLNKNSFEDKYTAYPTGWGKSIPENHITQTVKITDYNDFVTGTTFERDYQFVRNVKQVGEALYDDGFSILQPTKNGIDYHLTYFEGYPFSFDLLKIFTSDSVKIYHQNTGIMTDSMIASSDDTFRIYIDKATSNWNTSNFLPLNDNLNKLNIYGNGIFKSNIVVNKVPAKCGVYLKWRNPQGGYSYYLFSEFFETETKYKVSEELARNEFFNVGDNIRPSTRINGKIGNKIIKIKAKCTQEELVQLESLFVSPSVQMYTANEPFKDGEWLDIQIKGDLSNKNKRHINNVSATIELPESLTLKL